MTVIMILVFCGFAIFALLEFIVFPRFKPIAPREGIDISHVFNWSRAVRGIGVTTMVSAFVIALVLGISAVEKSEVAVARADQLTAERDTLIHTVDSYAAMYFWSVEASNVRAILSTSPAQDSLLRETEVKITKVRALSFVHMTDSPEAPYEVSTFTVYEGYVDSPGKNFQTGFLSKTGHSGLPSIEAHIRFITDSVPGYWKSAQVVTREDKAPSCVSRFDANRFSTYTIPIARVGRFELQIKSTSRGWAFGFPPSMLGDRLDHLTKGVDSYSHYLALADSALGVYHLSFDMSLARSIPNYGKLFQVLAHRKEGYDLSRSDLSPTNELPLDEMWYFGEDGLQEDWTSRYRYRYVLEVERDPRDFEGFVFRHPGFSFNEQELSIAASESGDALE